jgi:hypothetical protein
MPLKAGAAIGAGHQSGPPRPDFASRAGGATASSGQRSRGSTSGDGAARRSRSGNCGYRRELGGAGLSV